VGMIRRLSLLNENMNLNKDSKITKNQGSEAQILLQKLKKANKKGV
jgi:hypothetical protein